MAREKDAASPAAIAFGGAKAGGLAEAAGSGFDAVDRRIVDESGVGIYQTAAGSGGFVRANPAMARMLGYDSPAELVAAISDIGRQLYVDPGKRADLLQRLATADRVAGVVAQLRRRDGTPIWVSSTASAIRDANDRLLYVIGTALDVTEVIDTQEALREAEENYRGIFENAAEGIYRSTLDGKQLRANPALVRLNGYESEEQLLAAVKDIAREWYVDPGRRAVFVELMLRDGGINDFVSEVYRHRTRERIWVSENARLVRDRAGRILYFEGSVLDITERKRGEEALRKAMETVEESSRAKSEFLANMSHELRTPLNAIIGFAEIMIGEMFGPLGAERYRDYVSDIHDSAQLLLQLIEDILDISKAEAGRLTLVDEPVDIAALIRSSTRMLQERARQGRVRLEERIARSLPLIRGDERRLRQVVLNLVSNAVKFTPADGRVEVSADQDGEGGVVVTVSDTGIGIDAADHVRVFEPFVQLHRPSGRQEGAGLGLPLCKKLIDLHDGSIVLSSQLGRGTSIEVHLPADRIVTETDEAP